MDGGSGGDYFFNVFPSTTLPFGPIAKENLDITCLVFDFSCWLDGDETLGSVSTPMVMLEPTVPAPPWQADYPIDGTTTPLPPDLYPLLVSSTTMTSSRVEVRVADGTPGLTYIVSVVASSVLNRWRKQVDCIVTVEQPLNSTLVGSIPPPVSSSAVLVITPVSGEIITLGSYNYVYVNNTSTLASLTFQLPSTGTIDFIEVSFLRPVSALIVENTSSVVLPEMPEDAYGPGAGIVFRYTSGGWVYWK